MTIQIIESTIPASKKGMGNMRGPTPSSRFTDVNNAPYLDDIVYCDMIIIRNYIFIILHILHTIMLVFGK